jgi:UDP-glucuronate 4-epimerase
MKILVTGAAGFIGYHLSKKLIDQGHLVVGLDNINDYYDPKLKIDRLISLGVQRELALLDNLSSRSSKFSNFSFLKASLEDFETLDALFKREKFDVVCNLAAQAGVRYSLENPSAYVQSNLVGFLNILECCRNHNIKHLVYASSSSVYGLNKSVPFKVSDRVDSPISLYAATKRSNELMAHTYSHLYRLPTTGLRFFTVYGPWGRPDMAMFLFVDALINGKKIKVFNNGNMERDFTYIDDIVNGMTEIVEGKNSRRILGKEIYKIYNIGNNSSVKLLDFVTAIENELGVTANKEMLPMQPGDVEKTWADVNNLIRDYGYAPNTTIKFGVSQFIKWYKEYYNSY